MYAYDLCLAIGVIHPDELWSRLSWRQWQGWLQYREECGEIGERREDIRQEVVQRRLMARAFGSGEDETPGPMWPYWDTRDPVELIESAKNTEAELVPKEGGGYEWRRQSAP